MTQTLVGQLLPSSPALRFADALWEASYQLNSIQRCVPLVLGHGGPAVGRVRYIEQSAPGAPDGGGQVYLAGLVDDRFTLDERRFFSLRLDQASKVEMLPGRRARITDGALIEVALVEQAASWLNTAAQTTPVDFTVTAGGYAYTLTPPHKAVLSRATHWSRQHHRSADHVLVADPDLVYATPTRRRRLSVEQIIENVSQGRGSVLVPPVVPPKAVVERKPVERRRRDVPAAIAASGHHVRFFDHDTVGLTVR